MTHSFNPTLNKGLLYRFVALLLMAMPWTWVVAETETTDPRIQSLMEALANKPPPKHASLRAELEAVKDKPMAQDFTLQDLQGKPYTLSENVGKTIFVHFWSIYCPKCNRELSTLEQMYELYFALKEQGLAQETDFLAVNFGESEREINKWAKARDISLKPDPEGDIYLLLDTDRAVTKQWKVRGLPSTFLLDEEGRIVAFAIGERDWTTPAILQQIGLLPRLGTLPE